MSLDTNNIIVNGASLDINNTSTNGENLVLLVPCTKIMLHSLALTTSRVGNFVTPSELFTSPLLLSPIQYPPSPLSSLYAIPHYLYHPCFFIPNTIFSITFIIFVHYSLLSVSSMFYHTQHNILHRLYNF